MVFGDQLAISEHVFVKNWLFRKLQIWDPFSLVSGFPELI
jgi:hypothetical protein